MGMFKMKKQKYDLIFSMGAACSCTSALRDAELQLASYPFDWLFGSDFPGRVDVITSGFKNFIDEQDLEFVFSVRSTRCDAYHNKHNDLTFNHDFERGKDLSETYPSVREKYDRRIGRLLSNIENANRILIVYIETPDSKNILADGKIKAVFGKIQKHWPNKTINLVYLSPDNNILVPVEKHISDNITRFIWNYKSKESNVPSYEVDSGALKRFFAARYVLNQPLLTRMKKKTLKFAIQFIPSHNIRVRMRKKYHVG